MPCQVGSQKVQREILAHWPTETYNAGCYNPNSWMDGTGPGTNRPGVPSAHQRGEAIDIGIHVPYRGRTSTGQVIFRWLHTNRDRLGIVQLIWSNQIWSANNTPGMIRPYDSNPHHDHIHVQFSPGAARNPGLTAAPFPGEGSAPAPTPQRKKPFMRFIQLGGGAQALMNDSGQKRLLMTPNEITVVKAEAKNAGYDTTTDVLNKSQWDAIPWQPFEGATGPKKVR